MLVLRERGCMRIPISLFLLVWLGGWGAGEWFAGRAFFWMLPRAIGDEASPGTWMTTAFVGVWLLFWTWGGIAALGALLRTLAGRDEIRMSPLEWSVLRGVAGFGITRRLPVPEIRGVFVTASGQVIAELDDRDVLLTRLGTDAEKKWIAAQFPRAEGLEDQLPRQWRAVPEGDGVRIEPRGVESVGCVVLLVLVAAGAVVPVVRFANLPRAAFVGCLVVAVLLTALALWAALGRKGWRASSGRLTITTVFAGLRRETPVDRDSLEITTYRDSDGDDNFALVAKVRGKERSLWREMNDDRTVRRLGRYLAARTGWTLRTREPS